jgi:BirA family biotin operon repressor/biotin-[acetyl-CoA-carboxylase] ligase
MKHAERVLGLLSPTNRFRQIRWLAETDSTNRLASDLTREGAGQGLVVIADHQTAGRGRLDRRWEAPAGSALLLSVVVDPMDLPLGRWHLLTAAVGLAARDAAAAVGAGWPQLKWPNDLLVGDRKLAGILAEAVGDSVVIGVGCNVTSAPPAAVCLEELSGAPVDRVALVAALLESLDGRVGRWEQVAADYRERCATVGQRVRVETGSGVSEGDALSIDDAGALVVRFSDGVRPIHAGDVVHLRPGGGAESWS